MLKKILTSRNKSEAASEHKPYHHTAPASTTGCISGHAIVPIGGQLFCIGGLAKGEFGDECSNKVFRQHTVGKGWVQVHATGDIPHGCFAHTATAVCGGEYIAVFGGMMNAGVLSNALYLLHVRSRTWKYCAASPTAASPCARWGHAVVTPDTSSMIICGGMSASKSLADLWQASFTQTRGSNGFPSVSWTHLGQRGAVPTGRRRHTAQLSSCRRHMYVFGGRDAAGTHYNDLHRFTFDTSTWVKLHTTFGSAKPYPRVGHCAAMVQRCGSPASPPAHFAIYDENDHSTKADILVIFGGSMVQPSKDQGYSVMNDTYAVQLPEDVTEEITWERIGEDGAVPTRTMSAAFVSNGRVFVHGGRDTVESFSSAFVLPEVDSVGACIPPSASPPAARFSMRERGALNEVAANTMHAGGAGGGVKLTDSPFSSFARTRMQLASGVWREHSASTSCEMSSEERSVSRSMSPFPSRVASVSPPCF